MAYPVTAGVIAQKNRREGSTPVYLYAIYLSDPGNTVLYYTSYNENITFFKPQTTEAQVYTSAPISHESIESNIKGEIGAVRLSITNVDRYIISLLLYYEGLRGCKVTILLVFKDALTDSSNYMLDEYYIDSCSVTEMNVSFTLTSKFVVDKVSVPTRVYRRDQCQWKFAATECAYSGVATSCDKILSTCRTLGNGHRYGAFPGIPTRNVYF